MVMLYDQKSAKKKLHPAYRGPFVIAGFGRDHGKSYKLQQINGTLIPRTYYGDHFKPFRPRPKHLITGYERNLPQYQNLRAGKATHKLPKDVRVNTEYTSTLDLPQCSERCQNSLLCSLDVNFTLRDVLWL
jgi:hypothetical protein